MLDHSAGGRLETARGEMVRTLSPDAAALLARGGDVPLSVPTGD